MRARVCIRACVRARARVCVCVRSCACACVHDRYDAEYLRNKTASTRAAIARAQDKAAAALVRMRDKVGDRAHTRARLHKSLP